MDSIGKSLEQVSRGVKQFLHNCLSGFGSECMDAVNEMGLKTRNSVPMLRWDMTFTKMLAGYPDVICTKNKSGCWEYVLLYDQASGYLFSFMRESRFKTIRRMPHHKRPIYVSALLKTSAAPLQQGRLFSPEDESPQRRQAIAEKLDAICAQFQNNGVEIIKNHAVVVFSFAEGQISSFNAYVLNTAMEVIHKEDWWPSLKPDIAPVVADAMESAKKAIPMKLTEKAKKRVPKNELVKPKTIEGQDIG